MLFVFKKKSVFFLIALVAMMLFSPLLLGVWVKQHQVRLLRALNRTPGVHVKVLYYHRGWFKSTSKILVKINAKAFHTSMLPGFPWKEDLSFQLQEVIKHGPLVLVNTNGHYRLVVALALYDGISLNDLIPLRCSLLYHIHGVTTHFLIPSLHINYMNWKKVQGTIFTTFGSGLISGTIGIDHLDQLPSKFAINQSWSIDRLRVRFHLNGINWLSGGSNVIQIGLLQWKDDLGHVHQCSGLLMDFIQNKMDGKSNINAVIHVNAYRVGKYVVGPYHLVASAANMNVILVRKLLLKMSRTFDWRVFYHQQFGSDVSLLSRLLASGMRISINYLSVSTPYGPLQFHGVWDFLPIKQFSWSNVILQGKLFMHAAAPRAWLLKQFERFYAKHIIRPSLSTLFSSGMSHFLHEDSSVLARDHVLRWEKMGYVTCYGRQCVSTLRFQGGEVSVNQKKLIPIKHLGFG